MTLALPAAAQAPAPALSGGAFGHYTKVGLFGGPASAVGPVPDVRLPPAGSSRPLTAKEAAGSAVYGPAHIFGGEWPPDVDVAPPAGPITVTTKGVGGSKASVTSTVDIVQRTPKDPKSPGGFGPEPPTQGDELHASCTATPTGATGTTRFVHAVMSKATDPSGEPTEEEPIPDNPPVNYTRTGVLTNVGDRYKLVYNEQFVDPDGSITVNAVHMYLLGDIAVGESIIGQVRCSTHGAAFANTPAAPPGPPATVAAPATEGGSGTSALPFVLGGVAVLVIVVVAVVVLSRRRRRRATPQPLAPDL